MTIFARQGLRLVATSTFVAGARDPLRIQVPTSYIKRFWCWLRGQLTISAVTVPGTIHTDGPANLVRQLEALVDGKPWKVGSGPSFLRIAQVYDQTEGVNDGLVSGAAGVYQFEALIPLLAESPSAVSPLDSLLDGREIRNIALNVTWGAAADLLVGNTSTLALANVTLDVFVEETEPFPKQGDFWFLREAEVQLVGVVTNQNTRFELPYNKGSVYRAIQLRTIDGADLSDAVINNISLRVNGGQEIPLNNLEDDFAQARVQHLFGLPAMLPDGYYHLELSEGGRLLSTGGGAGAPDAGPGTVNSVELILDTTVGAGATSIVAHIVELVPPSRAQLARAAA